MSSLHGRIRLVDWTIGLNFIKIFHLIMEYILSYGNHCRKFVHIPVGRIKSKIKRVKV